MAAGTTLLGGPCEMGLVFAMPIEADAFACLGTNHTEIVADGMVFHEFTLAENRVAWCVAGVGRTRAGRAAKLLVDGHRPRSLVSAGFAGGLDPQLARGTLVRPTSVRGIDDSSAITLAGEGGPTIVTVDAVLHSAADKRALAAKTGAAMVDMETLAVATVAREAGLPCHGLRIISDAAGDELPRDIGRLIEPQSTARKAGAVLGMLGRRPRAALDLWNLWERAVVDGRTLAAALAELIASHPSPGAPKAPSAGRG